jgi:hypothetical protein
VYRGLKEEPFSPAEEMRSGMVHRSRKILPHLQRCLVFPPGVDVGASGTAGVFVLRVSVGERMSDTARIVYRGSPYISAHPIIRYYTVSRHATQGDARAYLKITQTRPLP